MNPQDGLKKKRFTFKNDTAPTGLSRIAWQRGVDIKLNKCVVGRISPPRIIGGDGLYSIRLLVPNENQGPENPCEWKWLTLKATFGNEAAAKEWVQAMETRIRERYKLFLRAD